MKESKNFDLDYFLSIVNEGTEQSFKQYIISREKRQKVLSSIGFSDILSSAAHGEIFDAFFKDTLRHLSLQDFSQLKAGAEENSLTLYSQDSNFHISFKDDEYELVYKHKFPKNPLYSNRGTVEEIKIVKGTKQEIRQGTKRVENGIMTGVDFEKMIIDENGFVKREVYKGADVTERNGKTISFDGAAQDLEWDGYPGNLNIFKPNKATILKNIRETIGKYPHTRQAYEELYGKELVQESLQEEIQL